MTVLACVDGSPYLASVCDYAARSAKRLGVGVILLHAIERPPAAADTIDRSALMTVDMADTALEEFSRLNEARGRLAQDQGRIVLDTATALVRGAGVEDVQERLVFGELVDSLHDYEHGVRLIVMGKRGESASRATSHLGSNLERMVRASHHPMLIVTPDPRPLRRFVVAYDASPSSRAIIDTLTREPLLLEADCTLLTVGDSRQQAEQLAAAGARLREVGYRVTEVQASGHADEVILDTVRGTDADLLVMGAYGHSRLRALIIGSTTTALLRDSPVPILVIR